MAAPGRALRTARLTPGELYRRHVQRKKMIALIAGLLLLPVSLLLIVSYDRGPLGQAVSQAWGVSIESGQAPQSTATLAAIAQAPTPTACLDTVFNGLVYDAETDALLGGVQVEASFGAEVVTSPDGEFNILVCYDPGVHDGFSLIYERDDYESASLDVVTSGYPGISFRVADMGLHSILSATPVPTLFQPPRQTPLPTPVPTLFQPPRQTPLPTPVPTLFQPPRQTPLPTPAVSSPDIAPTAVSTRTSGEPAPTAAATAAPPNTLPETGLPSNPFPGQAVGFVLLAISLMLIAAGVWPESEDGR